MKISTAFVIVLILLASSVMVIAQSAPPAPPVPTMPARPGALSRLKPLLIGPTDRKGDSIRISGKTGLYAAAPKDSVKISEVEVYVDNNIIGRADKSPYMVEFDTTTVPDGKHTLKAIAKDAENKDVWSAITEVIVNNSETGNLPTPQLKPAPSSPAVMKNTTQKANENNIQPPTTLPAEADKSPDSAQWGLTNIYASEKYGFSVQYPGNWVVEDATAKMKPKSAGGFWFVFGEKPINKAGIVVNIRRQKLDPKTDADTFAKYNDYVNKWERKTILDAPAFTTTGGLPESKRVVHRTIIIKNGNALMLNCIDTTGRPADESAKLFESIINTIKLQ